MSWPEVFFSIWICLVLTNEVLVGLVHIFGVLPISSSFTLPWYPCVRISPFPLPIFGTKNKIIICLLFHMYAEFSQLVCTYTDTTYIGVFGMHMYLCYATILVMNAGCLFQGFPVSRKFSHVIGVDRYVYMHTIRSVWDLYISWKIKRKEL